MTLISELRRGIREMGAASTVLLKNTNSALPLKKPVSMAVIGTQFPDWCGTCVRILMRLLGSDAASPLRGPNGFTDRAGVDGTLAMGWGSG